MHLELGPLSDTQVSQADFADVRARSRAMRSWVTYDTDKSSVAIDTGAPRARLVTAVSGNFFEELGAPIALGRGIRPTEDQVPGRDAVAVISHGLWTSLFGGNPHVLGRRIFISNHPFTVIGVTAERIVGISAGEG